MPWMSRPLLLRAWIAACLGRWSKTDYFKQLLEILSAAECVLNDYSLSEAHRRHGNVIFRIPVDQNHTSIK